MQHLILRLLILTMIASLFTHHAGKVAAAESSSPPTIGRVERLDPALDQLLPRDAKIEVIGQGMAWCEGPVWIRDGEFLLCSDIPNNALMRWDAKKVLSYS